MRLVFSTISTVVQCSSCGHRHSLPDSLLDLHDVARCDFCRETRDTKPSPCDMYRPLCLYTALPADQAPDNHQRRAQQKRRADVGPALLLETVLQQYKRARWGGVGQLPIYGLIGLSCIWCEVGFSCVYFSVLNMALDQEINKLYF